MQVQGIKVVVHLLDRIEQLADHEKASGFGKPMTKYKAAAHTQRVTTAQKGRESRRGLRVQVFVLFCSIEVEHASVILHVISTNDTVLLYSYIQVYVHA